MNTIQEKVHDVIRSLACNMADKEPREWPPRCLVLTYQPMRPEVNPSEDTNSPKE